MVKVETVEALLAQVASGDVDAVQVLEDAIREGVDGAGKARYLLVEQPAWRKFGVSHVAQVVPGAYAVVVPGKSIRIVGIKYPTAQDASARGAYDRTFEVGDVVEYDSFNLSYHGKIASIGARVVVQKPHSSRKASLTVHEFTWRNWDLDLAEAGRRNSDISMSL